jgi:hypothetical protein
VQSHIGAAFVLLLTFHKELRGKHCLSCAGFAFYLVEGLLVTPPRSISLRLGVPVKSGLGIGSALIGDLH